MSTATSRIYIVRHGETHENRNGIMQGQLDSKLNEVGIEQAKLVAESLREVPFEVALSSDLSRASDTAETILAYHPDVNLRKQEALRERYMGELQGKPLTRPASDQTAPQRLVLPPSVETTQSFTDRVLSWWDGTILPFASENKSRESPQHMLVTSHGGVISALVRSLLATGKARLAHGLVIAWKVPNVSVTIIDVDKEGKGTIIKFGDVSFLEEQMEKEMAENVDEKIG